MILTERRKRILDFVDEFLRDHGFPPSIREIGAAVGLSSTKSVKDHVDKLVEAGLLNRSGRNARTLTLQKEAGDRIPVIGQVAAGLPILAQENVTGYVSFPGVPSRGHFFLRVKGDSMTGAGILEGDLVLVRSQPFVEQREIAVMLVGEEATVKRFFRRSGNRVELRPENPAHSTMIYGPSDERVSVEGKVIAVLRLLEDGALRQIT
jgi:repressor LexA